MAKMPSERMNAHLLEKKKYFRDLLTLSSESFLSVVR